MTASAIARIPPRMANPIGSTESFVPGNCADDEPRFAAAIAACDA